MITFEAIDAGHGDAIVIRYMGDMGFERVMLIDAGPDSAGSHNGGSYSPLKERIIPRLLQIKAERDAKSADEDITAGDSELALDLMVCTHVHDDHIDGVVRLFAGWSNNGTMPDGAEQITAPRLWHNSFSRIVQGVDIDAATVEELATLSIPDGDNLSVFADAVNTKVNKGADGNLVAAGHAAEGFGAAGQTPGTSAPVQIHVLNPGKEELLDLKKEWAKNSKLVAPGTPLTASGVPVTKEFSEDNSVLNLSSITMLIEWEKRRILLTGDQRGDFVLRSLEAKGMKEKNKPFHVDILKIPHHGSKANVQKKFIAGVTADIYVFSANGKDQNPDPEVLEIVAGEAAKGRKFTMAFTNGTMNYVPLDGVLPSFVNGPKKIKTLADAIKHLKTMPGVADNVNFEFRGADNQLAVKNEHALIYQLNPLT